VLLIRVAGERIEPGAGGGAEHLAIGAWPPSCTSVVVAIEGQDTIAAAAGTEASGAETHLSRTAPPRSACWRNCCDPAAW
jgi:hypothetical protein